jgi:hypothetical protein
MRLLLYCEWKEGQVWYEKLLGNNHSIEKRQFLADRADSPRRGVHGAAEVIISPAASAVVDQVIVVHWFTAETACSNLPLVSYGNDLLEHLFFLLTLP